MVAWAASFLLVGLVVSPLVVKSAGVTVCCPLCLQSIDCMTLSECCLTLRARWKCATGVWLLQSLTKLTGCLALQNLAGLSATNKSLLVLGNQASTQQVPWLLSNTCYSSELS